LREAVGPAARRNPHGHHEPSGDVHHRGHNQLDDNDHDNHHNHDNDHNRTTAAATTTATAVTPSAGAGP
jgi:hypothetical protein